MSAFGKNGFVDRERCAVAGNEAGQYFLFGSTALTFVNFWLVELNFIHL